MARVPVPVILRFITFDTGTGILAFQILLVRAPVLVLKRNVLKCRRNENRLKTLFKRPFNFPMRQFFLYWAIVTVVIESVIGDCFCRNFLLFSSYTTSIKGERPGNVGCIYSLMLLSQCKLS